MRLKSEIKKKYEHLIKCRKDDNRYYIYINRRQLSAPTKEDLYHSIYELFYGRQMSSMADLFNEWMKWKRDNSNVSGKTLKELKFLWDKHLAGTDIAQIPLVNLKAKDFVQLFRSWTKNREMTRKYFNNIKSVLNGIYAYAIENEIVQHNPIKEINMRQFPYKAVNNEHEVFTLQERSLILDSLKTSTEIYALAIQLDFFMVCRIGELLALRWSDIQGNFIRIQGQYLSNQTMNDDLSFNTRTHEVVAHIKGNTEQGFRFMPLMPETKEILERIRTINPDGEYILMHDGKQLNKDAFNRWLKKYCLMASVTPHSSHKIRFTVASMLYKNGVPLTTLQQLLGHTTSAMTLHYLRPVTPLEETYNVFQSALSS